MTGTLVVFFGALPLCCVEAALGFVVGDPEVLDNASAVPIEDGETGDVPEVERRPPHSTSVEPAVRIGCGDTPH